MSEDTAGVAPAAEAPAEPETAAPPADAAPPAAPDGAAGDDADKPKFETFVEEGDPVAPATQDPIPEPIENGGVFGGAQKMVADGSKEPKGRRGKARAVDAKPETVTVLIKTPVDSPAPVLTPQGNGASRTLSQTELEIQRGREKLAGRR